jgi:hypothetical protein
MEALLKLRNAINYIGGVSGFKPDALLIEIDSRLFHSTFRTIYRNLIESGLVYARDPIEKTFNTFTFIIDGVKVTYAARGKVETKDIEFEESKRYAGTDLEVNYEEVRTIRPHTLPQALQSVAVAKA